MADAKPIHYLYNPANQSPEALISGFVVRQGELRMVLKDLQECRLEVVPQHYLIQGMRGAGKTTLLLRLAYEIRRDPVLCKKLIPVTFNEEQYRINRLSRLWESILDRLGELDEELDRRWDAMQDEVTEEGKMLDLILSYLQEQGKQAVLFLENTSDILSRFDKGDSQRLREVLMTRCELRLVASTTTPLKESWDYDEPFYEFFKTLTLKGLNKKDTLTLLSKLGEANGAERVQEVIDQTPGRIEAMRRLTGGLPRTVVLLFEVFRDDRGGSIQELEFYLDRVTPLYKHRMDDFPPQQQEIVDALAIFWDAASAGEIAEKVRLPSKSVSAQLKKMVDDGMVNLIKTKKRHHYYQLSERFFNIWYLMRCGSRRDKRRVIWLVRFLQEWCDQPSLEDRANRHLLSIKQFGYEPRHAYLLTEALVQTGGLSRELEDQLIKQTREVLAGSELLQDLSVSDHELFVLSFYFFMNGEFLKADSALKDIRRKDEIVKAMLRFCELYINHMPQEPGNTLQVILGTNALLFIILGKEMYKAFLILLDVCAKKNKKLVNPAIFSLALANGLFDGLQKHFEKYNLQEIHKAHYYALYYFLEGSESDMLSRMGPELKETVEEIVKGVNSLKKQLESGEKWELLLDLTDVNWEGIV